ncbi:MAG TPA: hypothetical protein VGP70_10665 [Actinomadura sp.]|jgi:hypothetical protein|nr:hypothetical protein [Actinomadura sp.]
MTCDIVALVRNRPDVRTVIDGMLAFGQQFRPCELDGGVTQLYDPSGRLIVSIEVPVLVNVPGEIERMLGPELAGRYNAPIWWVDVRASADVPDATRMARRFADDLVHWQGGLVWDAEAGS